jgi:4'-phosphopantetheinyl transferase
LPSGALERSIRFNLSHSHDIAVYAFAQGREIGVDVEKIRPEVTGEDIAERVFSARELSELRSLPARMQVAGFFLFWTRKEAYLKARGVGMGMIPLRDLDVSLTRRTLEDVRSGASSRWNLRSIQLTDSYIGAVVAEGEGWEWRLWNWVS